MHALAITEQGTQINVEGDLLLVSKEGRVLRKLRLAEIDQVLLFGRVEISSGAIAALARRNVDVVFLTVHGRFRARLATRGSRNVLLRLAQARQAADAEFCTKVARAIITGKVQHQRLVLLRAQRKLRDPDVAQALGQMRLLLQRLAESQSLDVLRGLEGQAAALYFGQFGKLIQSPLFSFDGRNRRPPRDPVNACLSFGYALLTHAAETEVARCGLDPMIGFFHQPAYGRPSLVLDLIEEFRPFIDGLVLRLINRRQLAPPDFRKIEDTPWEAILASPDAPLAADDAPHGPEPDTPMPPPVPDENQLTEPDDQQDSSPTGPAVLLDDPGRRIFLNAFFQRLRQRLFYPPRQASLELRQILREQAYHLARVIEGKDPAYVPFVPR